MPLLNYNLKISSVIGGEKSEVEVKASGKKVDGALILEYDYDGTANKLTLEDKKIVQSRQGVVRLQLNFIDGEVTESRIFYGADGGALITYTKSLKVVFCGDNCKAELLYSFEEGGENNFVSVSAEVCK